MTPEISRQDVEEPMDLTTTLAEEIARTAAETCSSHCIRKTRIGE
jgi:hypothetical protein